MSEQNNITQEYLKSILDYNPETGIFRWKVRSVNMFEDGFFSAEHNCNLWNARFVGKPPGSIDNGYLRISINYEKYRAHILAWVIINGSWPERDIDHINLDRSDNRICNLRLSEDGGNSKNCPKRKDNKTGYKSVHFCKRDKKYIARIQNNGKRIIVGYFSTPEEAHEAYKEAALRLHGEYARF